MKQVHTGETRPTRRKAIDPNARLDQIVALAHDVAEEQMRNGTASSQVITHFLKLGTEKERLERELLEQQVELAKVKAEAIKAEQHRDEMYAEAMKAMAIYSGRASRDENGNDYE